MGHFILCRDAGPQQVPNRNGAATFLSNNEFRHPHNTHNMTVGDKLVGVAGLVLSIAIFAYYTTWVLVAPFVDNSVTSFHRFFPDRWWAIAGPCVLLAAAVTFVATFIRYVSSKKR